MTRRRRFEVLAPPPADGGTRARLGRLEHAATASSRRPRSCRSARTRRSRRSIRTTSTRSAPRSSWPTPTTCPCGPATNGSRGWAACTGSWPGTGRSSPTRAASRCVSLGDLRGRRRRRRHLPLATSTARSTGSRPSTRSRSRRRSAPTSRSPSTSRSRRTRRPRGGRGRRDGADPSLGRALLAAHKRADQALFGIIQGGLEPDLRAESTRFIASLPFDGICIGGLAGDETRRAAPRRRSTWSCRCSHDDPRPRYLMGLGSPAGPAGGRGSRAWTCSTRSCRRGSPATARCGCRTAGSTCATPASWTTRDPIQEGCRCLPAGRSRGPTSPTCSGPTSCSPTGSRLVTT